VVSRPNEHAPTIPRIAWWMDGERVAAIPDGLRRHSFDVALPLNE
jgi:hypothetical protein